MGSIRDEIYGFYDSLIFFINLSFINNTNKGASRKYNRSCKNFNLLLILFIEIFDSKKMKNIKLIEKTRAKENTIMF